MTQTTLKRKTSSVKKVTTTVRIDSNLKARVEEFARLNHMDFSTFLTFSLHTTIQNGGKIEPRMSDEKYVYFQKMVDDIDAGIELTYGPFMTPEENRAFLDSIK